MMNMNRLLVIPELSTRDENDTSNGDRQRVRKRNPVKIHQDDSRVAANIIPSAATVEESSSYQPSKKSRRIDYEWKEDERLDQVREQMLSVLEQRMKQKSSNENPALLSALVEKILFNRATSLNDYLCLDKLDTKLKSVMKALMERKLRKADTTVCRRTALGKAIGDQSKYEQAASLVEEIKRLRGTGPALIQSSSYATDDKLRKPVYRLSEHQTTELSAPVRALFFDAELVTAFERTPIAELQSLCWKNLITNAERIIEDYYNWTSSSD